MAIARPRARSSAVWGLTAGTATLAVALYVLVVHPGIEGAPSAVDLPAPVVLAVVTASFAVAELFVVHRRLGRDAYAFSLSEVPLVVGLFFLRPDLLVVARLVGALVVIAGRRQRPRKAVFNLSLFALEVTVAVAVWTTVVGDGEPLGPRGWLATGLTVVATSALGSSLVSLVIATDTGRPPPRLWNAFGLGQLADLVNATVALVIVHLLSADWRAVWMIAVMVYVLALAQRGYERLQRRTASLEQLSRFTRQVGPQLDIDAVVGAVLAQVRDAVGAQSLQLSLIDPAGGRRSWSLDADRPRTALPASTGALDTLAVRVTTSPLLVPRHTRDVGLREALRTAGVSDFLGVPLRAEGQVIGVLALADRLGDVDSFSRDDLRQVEALANHAGVVVANAGRADQLRRQAQQREFQAVHDELTGLANRRGFGSRLEQVLAAGPASVLLLDLDRFKEVNDTLGYQLGDALLRLVATRLAEVVPPDALVARFGSDEFAVLLPAADRPAALACAEQMTGRLALPFDLDGLSVAVLASIGVAVAAPGVDAVTAVRWADVAMYAAKAHGRDVEVYRPELDQHDPSRLGLLADLREAVATGAIALAYQPTVDVATGRVLGVEGLVRWSHPQHGPIPPEEIVALAEHSGLITPLTTSLLRVALGQCGAWRAAGHDLGVSVNISPRSLLDTAFLSHVADALRDSAFPPRALTLEITEHSLMAEPERAIAALRQLRALGVRLSVDDLGTGYSSLAYLQRLPVDEVKVDRSFLQAMPGDEAEAVVGAIIDLGHRLGRVVVAEGVESAGTWEQLRVLGCDAAQGFWISRPVPAGDIPGFLVTWPGSRGLLSTS